MSTAPDAPELAKVRLCQTLLFPQSARALSEAIGLNWWAAISLHQDGWLSFDPEATDALDESQEHELRFVGSLVTGGCSPVLLTELLNGLERPYCYDGRRVYYDWSQRRWRLLPQPASDPKSVFAEWLDALKEEGDIARLRDIKAEVDAALDSLPQDQD